MIEKLIKDAAEKALHKTAFITADGRVTYKELTERAEKYAALLRRQGSGPVVIYGDKQIYVFVSIVACIFARRAYVAVGSLTPEKRLEKIVSLCGASLIITEKPGELFGVTAADLPGLSAFEAEEPKPCDGDTAYIAFTSGTSGEPKGVVITYENLENFIRWMLSLQPLRDFYNGVVFDQAGFSFDLSVADTFFSLCTSGTLVAYNGDFDRGLFGVSELMRREKVSFAVMTPTFLRLCLCEEGFDRQSCPDLKCIYLCGETLRKNTALKLFSAFPDITLINAYGPTEATSAVSAAVITEDMAKNNDIPIGTVGGCACDVTVSDGRIIISGKSVGKGYLNGQCFGGIYDTGDLGHISGGYIYFDGRTDRQIKYKGYRIELEEIETCISEIDRVDQCAVFAKYTPDGAVKSIAALVSGTGPDLPVYVRERLKQTLPGYMIPKTVTAVDGFKITENGKTDRRGLL